MENDRDRELAGKVDALIGKHAGSNDDRNIPVLTEVIGGPQWRPQPDLSSNVPINTANQTSLPRTAQALQQLDDGEIDALSHEIFTRVFDRIDAQLANQLEDRLTTQLAAQISAAVTHVLGDLRQDIANEVGDAVNAAIADHLRKK